MTLTIQSLSNQGLSFPAGLWTAAAMLKKVHSIWQIAIQGSFYINPNHFYGIMVGKVVSLAKDNPFVSYPTVPFFIMARFLDLFEQEDQWNCSLQKWIDALARIQPIYWDDKFDDQSSLPIISKHSAIWFNKSFYCLKVRIQRIAMSSLDLGFQSFKLLMRVMDVVDLMSMEWASLCHRSTIESGVHVPRGLAVIAKPENQHVFLNRLKSKKIGLISVGEIYGAEKASEIAQFFFENLEFGLFYYQTTAGIFGDAIVSLMRQAIYDWSPQAIKKYLENHQLDPTQLDWLKKRKNKKSTPFLTFTNTFEIENFKINHSPLKVKGRAFLKPSHFPSEPKCNVYRPLKNNHPPIPNTVFTWVNN